MTTCWRPFHLHLPSYGPPWTQNVKYRYHPRPNNRRSRLRWPRLRPRVACPMAWCPPSTHLPARGRSGATRAPSDQTALLLSYNSRTSHLNTARRRSISPQSSARSDPQRWMPPPPRPLRPTRRCTTGLRRTALRPLRPLPPALLPIQSLSRSAIPAQPTTTLVAGFGQVQPPPACLHVHASRPFPPPDAAV